MTTYSPLFRMDRIQSRRFCRNGMVTSGWLERLVRDGVNHCVAYRRKAFWKGSEIATVGTPSGSVTYAFAMRTGYGATRLRAHIGLLSATSGADPRAWLQVTPGLSGGTAVDGSEVHYPVSGASDVPDNFHWGDSRVDVSGNTTYRVGIVHADNARVFGACVFEEGIIPVDTTVLGVDPRISRGSQIVDANTAALHAAMVDMFQRNRAQLLAWSADDAGTGPTHSGTTWTNPLDSNTAVFNWTAGATLNLQHRNSAGDGTVPVTFAVSAAVTSGAGTGEIRLTDGTNSLTITGISSAGYYSTTGTIAASDGLKWDIQARTTDGSTTVRLDSANLWIEE